MDVFERLRRLQGKKKKQVPSPLRQVIELHITEQDLDDEALKKKVLYEALNVFNAEDQTYTIVFMIGLYKAMGELIEAQGLKMDDLEWMIEQDRQFLSRFSNRF